MPTDAALARPAGYRALSALARLARAEMTNDAFQHEAAAILRQAVGFDWWCWPLNDPGARLPSRYAGVKSAVDHDYRRFCRLMIAPGTWDAPEVWTRSGGDPRPAATAISTATGGDFRRDLLWREMLGPAGSGDVLTVLLIAGDTCWGQLHLGRDHPGHWFTADDERLLTEAAPLLAARLRDGLRAPRPRPDHGPGPELGPGTIIVDRDLSLVAATEDAWHWLSLLGLPRVNDAEPLPGFIYAVATRAAAPADAGLPPRTARVRLQDTDGHWAVVRAAPLARGAGPFVDGGDPGVPGTATPAREPAPAGPGTGGYAITVERARSEDLAPLLMRAWGFTPRERDVARLVIDGLATDDIAACLFVSAHTVRDHLKAIFGKTRVTRRGDLTAALAGQAPADPA